MRDEAVQSQCPSHGPMALLETRHGFAWKCMAVGCTVMCWDKASSRPADQATRKLRWECHNAFDALWMPEDGVFSRRGGRRKEGMRRGHWRGVRRANAYRWLAATMQLTEEKAHIGMFDADQCRRLLAAIQALVSAERAHGKENAHV